MMRLMTSCIFIVLTSTVAEANFRTKVVPAGQTTRVAVYTAWHPERCGSVFAIVKVTSKPQNGKLSNTLTNTTIPVTRFTGRPGPCFGKPTKGFEVYYTPAKGFRGPDTFSLEISWPAVNRVESDVFSVSVQ